MNRLWVYEDENGQHYRVVRQLDDTRFNPIVYVLEADPETELERVRPEPARILRLSRAHGDVILTRVTKGAGGLHP